MASVNKVILIGNLGKDPEIKPLSNENKVANFSIATTEKYKDQEFTEWHELECWGKLADVVEKYIKKGNQVYIEGKIKTDTWENEAGEKRRRTKIRVSTLTMLGGSKAEKKENIPGPEKSDIEGQESDDLPF